MELTGKRRLTSPWLWMHPARSIVRHSVTAHKNTWITLIGHLHIPQLWIFGTADGTASEGLSGIPFLLTRFADNVDAYTITTQAASNFGIRGDEPQCFFTKEICTFPVASTG